MNNITIFIIALFLFSCSSNEIKDLKNIYSGIKTDENRFVRIKLNNFKDFKTKIIVNFQDYESFAAENFKYEQKFDLNQSDVNGDYIDVPMPKGIFIGSITLITKNHTPFYKNITGFYQIFFGVDSNYSLYNASKHDCRSEIRKNAFQIPKTYNTNFCNSLDLSNSNKIITVSLDQIEKINPESTILLLYTSISIGTAKYLSQYPYAPFLIIHTFLGITQNDILINFENYSNL
ncbi:hypothetical protein [Leptospira kanakyensis]|uniref:Uncharacterized protein n=1 Tax=Leptospira kanakyensis TaxID=2484968 RepID=A0A6N4QA65_9LEPT|nr:hypothetical protein [Leptospira kanakyensis]TGK76974.1 hypothetical protein EHQ18_00075 [Leptospira kanakyensis]